MSDGQNKPTRQRLQSLAHLPAKQRLDALLDFEDAKLAVQSAAAEDLYIAISEVGLEDATDIVQLVSPAQFRTFVDLAGWKKDRIDPDQILLWLRAARGDEPEEFLAKVQKMDLEVLEYLLRERMTVHDLEEDPDVNPEGVTYEMPENRYLLEFRNVEGVELAALRQLVSDLVAADPFQASRLFEATRWEVPSELEETAYQFRSARLQDLGFPELYDALSIFAFVNPDPYAPQAPAGSAATAMVRGAPPASYLEACFRGISESEQGEFEEQLRLLINSALVAEGAEPGEPDAIRRVSEGARDLLALGLEHATGGAPDRATEAVRAHGFRRIFQIGFSLTLRLKFRAERLAKSEAFAHAGVPLLLPYEARVVEALRRRRPLRALKVEGADPVPFRSSRELEEIDAALVRAEQQVAVVRSLLGGMEEASERLKAFAVPFEELGTSRLVTAIVARAAIGLQPWVGPVPEAHHPALGRALFEGEPATPRLVAGVGDRVLAVLAPAVPEAARAELGRMVASLLETLREELGPAFLREGRLAREAAELLPLR